jgi:uncharacterized protein YaeQ
MALKAIIYKAELQVADMDRNVYGDHSITIARHPSETDERMLFRLLVFALNAPTNNDHGDLEFAKDLWDSDEPALWQKDFTGEIRHWIEVGQPDEKRLMRASGRAGRVSVYTFNSGASIWWNAIAGKLTRARNLSVWRAPADQAEALASLAERSMKLQVTVQDGAIWVGDGERSVEITLERLCGAADTESSPR